MHLVVVEPGGGEPDGQNGHHQNGRLKEGAVGPAHDGPAQRAGGGRGDDQGESRAEPEGGDVPAGGQAAAKKGARQQDGEAGKRDQDRGQNRLEVEQSQVHGRAPSPDIGRFRGGRASGRPFT